MNCQNCGAVIQEGQVKCLKCGTSIQLQNNQPGNFQQSATNPQNVYVTNNYNNQGKGKSWLVTLLLCIFIGYLGVHRFYTGSIGIGLLQLFTGSICGIWWFIDLILILVGSYRDGNGNPLDRNS